MNRSLRPSLNRNLIVAALLAASLTGAARAEVAFEAAGAYLTPPDGFMAMPTAQYVAMTSFGATVQLYAYPLFGDSPEVAAREVAALFPDATTRKRKVGKRPGLAVENIRTLLGFPTQGAGLAVLSPHGGGVLVVAFDASGLDDKELALAERVAASARFVAPRKAPAQKLALGGQGRGWLLRVRAPAGFHVRLHEAERLVLDSARPPRRVSVTMSPFQSASGLQRELERAVVEVYGGELLEKPRKVKGGACARLAMSLEGQPQEGALCVRVLKKGVGALVLGVTAPLYADEKLARDVEALALGIRYEKEKIDPRAARARNAIAGFRLWAGSGTSSNSMNYDTSATSETKWWFCPDGSYRYYWYSVISLGEFGGRTNEDRHNGRWWIEQVGRETQLVIQRADNGQVSRYVVSHSGNKVRLGNSSYFKEPTSCR